MVHMCQYSCLFPLRCVNGKFFSKNTDGAKDSVTTDTTNNLVKKKRLMPKFSTFCYSVELTVFKISCKTNILRNVNSELY